MVAPRIVNLFPDNAPAVPELQILATFGRIIDVWVTDLRPASPAPPTLYVQIFNTAALPVPADRVMVTPIATCPGGGSCAYRFDQTPFPLEVSIGAWITLSTTPWAYTPIAANQLFSITARVSP